MPERDTEKHIQLNEQLRASIDALEKLQHQFVKLGQCETNEEILNLSEMILLDIVDFDFNRIYLTKGTALPLQVTRNTSPADFIVKDDILQWALKQDEASFIPPENPNDLGQLLIPLSAPTMKVGVIILWVDSTPDKFTTGLMNLINISAREIGSVIESKMLLTEITEARKLLTDVIENVPQGIIALSGQEISLINSTALFMLNLHTHGSLIGKTYRDIFPTNFSDLLRRMLGQQAVNSVPGEQEIVISYGDHPDSTLGISIAQLNLPESKSDGCVFILRDISLSREVVKLRELDAAKTEFVSLISHELRTPLSSIMAYCETLLAEGMIEDFEERKDFLRVIYSEGERLNRLVNDVLDITKMESAKLEYTYSENDIINLCKQTIMTITPSANEKIITIKTDYKKVPLIRFDYDRITQVLLNLLSNAIKFTNMKGEILISIEFCPASTQEDFDIVCVSIKDNGIGIDPEDKHKVFNKFEQIEHIDNHQVGTGLGMPICELIITEGHGGKIWFESELGVGSTFFFTLPC